MPDGFVGKACKKNLTLVKDTVTSAQESHNKNPFDRMPKLSVPPPSLPERNNQKPPYIPDSATSGSYTTGIGKKTNIVMNDSEYDQIMQKITDIDEKATEGLKSIAVQIKSMCETIYIIPKVLPEYKSLVSKVKDTFPELPKLTDTAKKSTKKYVDSIVRIDNK